VVPIAWDRIMDQLQPKRIDRSDLLARPLFWAVHSHEQARTDHWVEEFFGLAPDDLKGFWQRELPSVLPEEPDLFPSYCFPLPLREGCTASVEYEACPGDFGIAYSVHHPAWEAPALLSRYPSVCDWPPFRWEEEVLIAEAVQGGTADATARRAALPLLFPGVWLTTADDLGDVRARLRSAWANLRVVQPAHLDAMVTTMVEAQGLQEPWRHDPRLGWVNGGWNYRNPEHSAPAVFAQVKHFFAALDGPAAASEPSS
jgi:hypothetical protein